MAIDYSNGSMGVRDTRAPSNALRFQIDSGAEKQEYSNSTGWFQTALGYQAWLIVDSAQGQIIGAGYHQNAESSYVVCGVSRVATERDPASIFPDSAPPVALTCYYLTGAQRVETFYIRDGLLFSVAAPGVVPVNGVRFKSDPESTGGGGYFMFTGETNIGQRLMLKNSAIQWVSGFDNGRNCS